MISLKSISLFLTLLTAIISSLYFATGHAGRTYSTLALYDSVKIAGNIITASALSTLYKPQIFRKIDCYSPPALTMWWEAIDNQNAIILVYHPVWQDERLPMPILHWLYYAYRAIVYGVPVRDIEYIQININSFDGSIQRVRYEGSTSKSCQEWFGEHVYITIDREGDKYVQISKTARGVSSVKNTNINSRNLSFGIATWSHQFILLEKEEDYAKYQPQVNMPLSYLTEENYRRYKLARRSQGDFSVKTSLYSEVKSFVTKVINF